MTAAEWTVTPHGCGGLLVTCDRDEDGHRVAFRINHLDAHGLASALSGWGSRGMAHVPTRDDRQAFDLTECDREVERT